jgi:hypothetical protein
LYTNILQEHAASSFRVNLRRTGKLTGYTRLGGRTGQEEWPIRAMGGGGGDGEESAPMGKQDNVRDTRKEGRLGQEKE